MISSEFRYPVTDDMKTDVLSVLDRRIHHGGEYTEEVERRIAERFGGRFGVAVNSGSSAALVAMHALGIGPGDEVIVPASTYITTAEVVALLGATPVFAECEPDTLNISANAVEACITAHTVGVIVVHNYGHPCDMERIASIAATRGLWLVENCSHAFGAQYQGRPVGSFGTIAFTALSRKHLSICGTGGVAVTQDPALADKMRRYSIHGRDGYGNYASHLLGYNFRFNEIQACIAKHQLDEVDAWIAKRRENAAQYDELIAKQGVRVETPPRRPYASPSWLDYVIQTDERDDLKDHLNANGVRTTVRYAIPCHLHPVFMERFGHKPGEFPVTERACDRILSLPVGPDVSGLDVANVVSAMREFTQTL